MPPLSKQKRKSKDQPRTKDGRYYAKRTRHTSIDNHNLPALMLVNNNENCENRLSGAVTLSHKNDNIGYISGDGGSNFEWSDNEEWEDDEDSDWNNEDFAKLKETRLVWNKDNQFKKLM